jgi:hypothetical protein
MSKEYLEYLTNLQSNSSEDKPMGSSSFKCNQIYQSTLEHLSKEFGVMYLKQLEEEFPEMSYEIIKTFVNINDKFGSPIKSIFTMNCQNTQKLLYCSPTSLRYTYHALKILSYLKETAQTKVVELGVGYGGLFLAINYFSNLLNVPITNYYLIDLPEVNPLVTSYLSLNNDQIHIPYSQSIPDNEANLFFISNYCLSFVSKEYRDQYISEIVQPRCDHGFMTWQTSFGVNETQVESMIQKSVMNVLEEVPQTGPSHAKNYYITF